MQAKSPPPAGAGTLPAAGATPRGETLALPSGGPGFPGLPRVGVPIPHRPRKRPLPLIGLLECVAKILKGDRAWERRWERLATF